MKADETEKAGRSTERSRIAVAGGIAGAIVVVAAAAAWIEREPIVAHYADRALAARKVPARYRLVAVGPFSQRLEDVSIGDPAAPDLVARAIDVRLGYDLHGPHLVAVRAEGVRLRARLEDGRLLLGAIDRLLPAPAPGAPAGLPAIGVSLADTMVTVATPAGRIVATAEGAGTLSDGFRGRVHASARRLRAAGCMVAGIAADLHVTIADRRPHVVGPVRISSIGCPSFATGPGRADADLDFASTLDRWRGRIAPAGFAGRARDMRFGALGGTLSLHGSVRRIEGGTDLTLAALRTSGVQARDVHAAGRFRYAAGATGLVYAGHVSADHVAAGARVRDAVIADGAALAATPLAPIGSRAANALARAAADARVDATVALTAGGAAGLAARVRRLELVATSGAHAEITEGGGFGWNVAEKGWRADGRLRAGGGGLPALDATLAQARAGAPVSGVVHVADYAAGGARLAMAPLRFTAGEDTRFATTLTIDGPLGSGRVEGLAVPIAGRIGGDGLRIGEGCVPIGWRALAIAGMTLSPARVRVCGIAGAPILAVRRGSVAAGITAADVRLSGRSGNTPLRLGADRLRIDRRGLEIAGLAARLGRPDAVTRLDVAHLDGGFAGAVGGGFAGAGGQIGNVPLLLADAAGHWRFENGVLAVDGALAVSDAETRAPRFRAMAARDVALTLADGRIRATGALAEPKTGARVADVVIRHDLETGIGDAALAVPGIRFDKGLQPEMLTPLTLGVVANVAGTVAGAGRIAWNPRGVTSSGSFSTDRIDLAAAFGPVTGIRGTIRFSDLLGLVTPPGQTATIAEINPGVAVTNGTVRYRLLPGQRVEVDGARWPFTGGALTLDPTILAFGEDSVRRMTFRIRGLDAAAFVQQLAVPNLAATGTFDGVLPMLFDQAGGRIAGGHIVARPPGGTIAYVGEISRQQLGLMGKLAFDALKAIRYTSLAIDLDGRLDGEIVSRVGFTGVRQATPDASYAARLIRGLPFRFNIAIRAPFRALAGTARSYADPSLLLPQLAPPAPIQPTESEPVR